MWGLDTGRLCFCDYSGVWMWGHSRFLLEFSSLHVGSGKCSWSWHWQSPGPRPLVPVMIWQVAGLEEQSGSGLPRARSWGIRLSSHGVFTARGQPSDVSK